MKHVLIIDESELFREYLKHKLEESGQIDAVAAVNGLDGIAKMRAFAPDLIVIDYHLTRKSCKEVLEEKKRNPNTAKVPVVVTAAKIDKNRILELIPLDVKKVFSKPVRIDGLLNTIGSIVGARFKVDDTPCMLEAHVNDNIIFIEVAQGLNREKIEMLRFKLAELIQLYDIYAARVLLLMTDLDLSFADAPNLERLLDIVLAHSKAKPRNIRILTKSAFIREFINGHDQYSDIEASDNLQSAIDGLLAVASAYEFGDRKAEMITERLLSSDSARGQGESFQMRFEAEAAKAFAVEDAHEVGRGLRVAVVDDDPVIRELCKTTFSSIAAEVRDFADGQAFLDAYKAKEAFDLILLDLVMPKLGGFAVLQALDEQGADIPVIVLSAISQRDAIVKAFQAGVKSYLIKPLKPAALIKKAAETLRANF
jgi:CheY-like chemotaxis protein